MTPLYFLTPQSLQRNKSNTNLVSWQEILVDHSILYQIDKKTNEWKLMMFDKQDLLEEKENFNSSLSVNPKKNAEFRQFRSFEFL